MDTAALAGLVEAPLVDALAAKARQEGAPWEWRKGNVIGYPEAGALQQPRSRGIATATAAQIAALEMFVISD